MRPLARSRRRWIRYLGRATPFLPLVASDHFSPDWRAVDYRTGEKAVGISSLFSCRTGRTPVCGGHAPPGFLDSSRTLARSLRSLYVYPGVDKLVEPAKFARPAGRQG